ncbi:MAG: hypothetical protein NTY19_26100 [Planctomycetota bacterium]|nr:hypothetical protein [Planctomycetota bacterium]
MLVRTKAMAAELGVQPQTLRKWVTDGKVKAVRVSPKTIRFEREKVLEELKARTTPSTPATA